MEIQFHHVATRSKDRSLQHEGSRLSLLLLFCRDGGLAHSEGKEIGSPGEQEFLFPCLFLLPLARHCWTKCAHHSVLFYSVLWCQLNRRWTPVDGRESWSHRLPAWIWLCLGLIELWEWIGSSGKGLPAGCEDLITEQAKSFGVHCEGRSMEYQDSEWGKLVSQLHF